MPDVVWKDLCFDAVHADVVARFWTDLLDLNDERLDNGDHVLRGTSPQRTIWVNAVPEPQEVKNRVHLDIAVPDHKATPDGASLVTDHGRWRVLADPDGLVWCACPPRHGESIGAVALGVDAHDPYAIATWWGERFGVAPKRADDGSFAWLEQVPDFPYGAMVFQAVPETKTVKNRAHWDIDLADAGLDDLVAAGATVLRRRDDEIRWTVLADPEGNEFCCFGK